MYRTLQIQNKDEHRTNQLEAFDGYVRINTFMHHDWEDHPSNPWKAGRSWWMQAGRDSDYKETWKKINCNRPLKLFYIFSSVGDQEENDITNFVQSKSQIF